MSITEDANYLYLSEIYEQTSNGGDNNESDDKKGNVLRPELYVHVEANVVDQKLQRPRYRVHSPDAIKNDIYRALESKAVRK